LDPESALLCPIPPQSGEKWRHPGGYVATVARDDFDLSRLTRKQRLRFPAPPSNPLGSPEIRLLQAFLDAYAHHLNSPLSPDFDPETGEPLLRNRHAEAEWESAQRRELARAEGEYRVDRLPMAAELRALFALPPPQAVMKLLGYWSEEGIWTVGLAELSERETEAMTHYCNGLVEEEIQKLMSRRRSRRRQALGAEKLDQLSLRTIDNLISSSRSKLRRLFGVRPRVENPD
jgi:hypothetical protein